MNVPIRMLGIATSIFWIILVAFIASSAYSLKDLNLQVGEAKLVPGHDGEIVLTMLFSIYNGGSYTLQGFDLTTVFLNAEDIEISRATSALPQIQQRQNATFLHNATLNLNRLAEQDNNCIFDDSSLTCTVIAGLNFAELLPATLSANVSFPWGAPFYNIELGTPQVGRGNSSHTTVKVPLSYENHAAFNIAGSLKIRLIGADGTPLAETQKPVNSTRGMSYSGNVYFSVPTASVPLSSNPSGTFEVYFSTSVFDYGPAVIPYG